MASLVYQDTSGVFLQGPDEIEVPELRTRSFRRFRLPDAPDGRRRWRVGGSVAPVHYRTDPWDEGEEYKEIDLNVVLTPGEAWDAACETNGFQVRFWQSRVVGAKVVRYIAQFRRAGCSFSMAPLGLWWVNAAGQRQLISRTLGVGMPVIDNDANTVTWAGAFGPGLDFRYNLSPDQFMKQVIVQSKASLPAPTIGTAGLRLVVVMTVAWGGAYPANGFAPAVEDGDISGDDDLAGAADEELADPPKFAHLRADLREAFWCHSPRAWDSYAGEDGPHAVAVQWRLQRRGLKVLVLFAVTAAALNNAATVYPVTIDTVMAEETVGATSDDATSYGGTHPGTTGFYSNWWDQICGDALNFSSTGWRFTPPIPQGATIDAASLGVRSRNNYSNATDATFRCEDVDNGATFAADHTPGAAWTAGHVASQVAWTPGSWTAGEWYTLTTLAAAVEAIVGRASWVASNGLNIVCADTATGAPPNVAREVNSFDQGSPAVFNCTYTEAGGVTVPLFEQYYRRLRVG